MKSLEGIRRYSSFYDAVTYAQQSVRDFFNDVLPLVLESLPDESELGRLKCSQLDVASYILFWLTINFSVISEMTIDSIVTEIGDDFMVHKFGSNWMQKGNFF